MCVLATGSSGNSYLIDAGTEGLFLLDCGIPLAKLRTSLEFLGLDTADVRAVLVTHEHSDHSSHLASIARHLPQAEVVMTGGTWQALNGKCEILRSSERLFLVDSKSVRQYGDLRIEAVPVPHDAQEPVAWKLEKNIAGQPVSFGVLTDLGHMSAFVKRRFADCDVLALEFNYDEDMLRDSGYPAHLRNRVGSDYGHLSNKQSADFLREREHPPQALIACHISENTNSAELVHEILDEVLPAQVKVTVMPQRKMSGWMEVQ